MVQCQTILSRFDQMAATYADSCAVEGANLSLSYGQLDRASRLLAGRLHESGVRAGGFVPILIGRSPEFVVGVLAALRCGAAYAPIDPENPASRRESMLASLNSPVCLSDGSVDGSSTMLAIDPGTAIQAALDHEPDGFGEGSDKDDASDRDAPAYVMYTSGSTGQPKGVVVPHRAVVRLVLDADFAEFGPGQRWGLMSAVAFDASTLELWGALLHGGCCVIQESAVPSLDDLARFLVQKKIDAAWLTAALFNTMVDEQCESMAGLSQLLTGGERESVGHLRRFKRRCPEVRLIHGYGPTENTTFSLCHTITNDDLESDRVPIGRPIHGSSARIVEPGGTPDETPGRIDKGELLVGGDGLALGYLGRDDLTAERFVFDSAGTRWYRTGDLVERLPDGSIRFVGRIDRQVKIRGHRIELEEVETVLARCPGVLHAAVIVEGDDAATRRLVGAVVLEDEVPIDSVRKYLSEHLPRPMIPDRLVHLQEMARGSTGKIDRVALRAVLAQTEDESTSGAADEEPAQTPTERKFLELLSARLARSGPEGIGRRADFYEIGGHSLIAMRLATDIEGSLGVRIRPVDILTIRRVDLIAAHIDQLAAEDLSLESDGADPPELIDPIGDIRTRVLIESERDPTGRAMLVHQAWLVKPGLDIERVRALWQTILARHESLRCAFSFDGETPELLMLDPAGEPWLHAEPALRTSGTQVQSGLPREVIDAIGARIRADEMPVRVHHWALADDCSLIAVVYHHAVVDEWALELIEAELAGLLAGKQLPAQIEQYDQFVRLEQAWRDESAAEAIAQRLAGTDEGSVELPMAGPQAGLIEKIELDGDDEALARSIDDASARLGVLPAAMLLGVFGQTLVEFYGAPGRWVMTPISKRITPALQRVVGCCLDMRIIDCAGDPMSGCDTLREISQSIQQQILASQGESVLPVETVIQRVRQLNPGAAAHATRFGLTYRIFDEGVRPAGGFTLARIPVEQLAARFGLALHIERRGSGVQMWLEASARSFAQSDLTEFATRFAEHLHRSTGSGQLLCNPVTPPQEMTAPPSNYRPRASVHPPRTIEVLRGLWVDAVGVPPHENPNFFECGGSSLLAMRLASSIHARTGMKLHIGEFLRSATFDGLLEWVRDDPEAPYSDFRRAGGDRHGRVIAAFPGSSGRGIDLHAFWSAYRELDPSVDRMIGCDLATIAATIPSPARDQDIPDHFIDRGTQIASEQSAGQEIVVMGYSLGGLIAMGVVERLLEQGHRVSLLVLLDAYGPKYLARTPTALAAKVNARLRGRFDRNQSSEAAVARSQSSSTLDQNSRELWRFIHSEFTGWRPPRVTIPTILVRSESAARRMRPLIRASTNGLGQYLLGPLETITLPVDHLAILTSGSSEVARAVASACGSVDNASDVPTIS